MIVSDVVQSWPFLRYGHSYIWFRLLADLVPACILWTSMKGSPSVDVYRAGCLSFEGFFLGSWLVGRLGSFSLRVNLNFSN